MADEKPTPTVLWEVVAKEQGDNPHPARIEVRGGGDTPDLVVFTVVTQQAETSDDLEQVEFSVDRSLAGEFFAHAMIHLRGGSGWSDGSQQTLELALVLCRHHEKSRSEIEEKYAQLAHKCGKLEGEVLELRKAVE